MLGAHHIRVLTKKKKKKKRKKEKVITELLFSQLPRQEGPQRGTS